MVRSPHRSLRRPLLILSIACLAVHDFLGQFGSLDPSALQTRRRDGGDKPLWKAEYRLDENKDSILQTRPDFAGEILAKNGTGFVYRDSTGNSTGETAESWFIYSVATDAAGAKLSANLCASLLAHGISPCVMLGLGEEAVRWWSDNGGALPANAVPYDGVHFYRWAHDWNPREKFRRPLESYVIRPTEFGTARHVQAVVHARTFLFVDMLHRGVSAWMLDSDVCFPLDPRGMFLDPAKDCVYMMNAGNFLSEARYQAPYSYPFLAGGGHATVNNGIAACRPSPPSLRLWRTSVDRVLNHLSGDPQHPHNELLFARGLRLEKAHVPGYPDLGGHWGYYEGSAILRVGRNDSVSYELRAVSAASAYDQLSHDDLARHVAIHAVGVGGMILRQNTKCDYLKQIGYWHIESPCR